MIRALTKLDLPELSRLVYKIIHTLPHLQSGFDWNEKKLEGELQNGIGLGAFENEILQGFILYRSIGDIIEISVLGTDPGYHRKGIMKAILDEMIQNNPRAEKVWLEVHENNVIAIATYHRLGFREVGMRPRYYSDGGAALLMDKPLTQGKN